MQSALCRLGAVASFAEGVLPSPDGSSRSADKALEVASVFRLYEKRLREHSRVPGRSEMSNSQRELPRRIIKSSETALNALVQGGGDLFLALERAFANGTNVEELLGELVNSFDRDSKQVGANSGAIEKRSEPLQQHAPSVHMMPATTECYCARHAVPPLPDNLYLEFDLRNEDGKFCAPEGDLKSVLLLSWSSSGVIAARGAEKPGIVHGASGMAGVGKTMTLIALGHDKDVRDHFSDGILYITLGADASVKHITRGLSTIMKLAGASASADAVRYQTDLRTAVEDAALWFLGKRNLFLIDDVWPSKSCEYGFLPELRNILVGSPESRIVLTTRSVRIGSSAVSHVDFDARNPLGTISSSIFMQYATNGCRDVVREQEQDLASVQGILLLCAGLPIALAVTGLFVSTQV